MKTFVISQYQRVRELYDRYEKLLMPTMLVGGFLLDYITFANIEIRTTLAILFAQWFLAGSAILFIHFYDEQKLPISALLNYMRLFAPLLLQFTFGALLGSSLIFYWFSGAFSVSWPLFGMVVLLMIFNERFRDYLEKLWVQVSVYFFCTISLVSLALPFLLASLSAWLFVLASLGSLVLFLLDVHFLSKWLENLRQQKKNIIVSIFCITIIMNLLYFTNIIPPIPLALRDAGVYHNLYLSGGKYVMKSESENFFKTAIFGQTIYAKPGEKIYLYTAIFAPAKLQTTIVHRWQYYDEIKKEWIDKGKLSFIINGGRKDGYKGYSWLSNLAEGKWRVYVQNERGQVLGVVRFSVKNADTFTLLKEVVR